MKSTPAQEAFVAAHLTGELKHNSPEISRQAVREMIARNPYWTFDIKMVADLELDYDEVLAILLGSLGVSHAEFEADPKPYIDPATTLAQLRHGLARFEEAAAQGETILLATGHPGSLLGFYQLLGDHLVAKGASIFVLDAPIKTPNNRWVDQVGHCLVLSDEGSLMHTHKSEGLEAIIETESIDWLISDHGMAGAGINSGINVMAFFDTDDVAIPTAADSYDRLTAVPMNDNQTNTRTTAALRTLLEPAA